MTSKTFKSEHGRSLTIDPSDGHNIGLGTTGRYLALKIEDAPALALAILEAAGYSEEYEGGNCWAGPLGQAMHMLRLETEAQERAIAESRERAELEAEAFNLYRAYMSVHEPLNAIGDWHMLAERTKEKWLAVARRARELAKEATK